MISAIQHRNATLFLPVCVALMVLCGCRKLVQIPPPVGTITTSQVFSTDQQAISAMSGIYYYMANTTPGFASSSMTILGGVSADELTFFSLGIPNYVQFQNNALTSANSILSMTFWQQPYYVIYQANAILTGLANYSGVHDSVKNELIGEAEFIRAFCNFYLVNLFGPIPLANTINYKTTSLLSRADTGTIYQAIVSDLLDAKKRLASDYSAGSGQRIVPNRSAAAALLARVYLYTHDWTEAEAEASEVIGNTALYGLVPDLNGVFLANSTEAIWQLQQQNETSPFSATPEGFLFVPANSNFRPYVILTSSLLSAFETGDGRKSAWVDSVTYAGVPYPIPYKYKVGGAQAVPNGPYTEYYMVLRLAEQYLIRAEAEANGAGAGLTGAVADLSAIRERAGLTAYQGPIDPDSIRAAIYHERQVEFFAEWGQRWLDLKRRGDATTILSNDKGHPIKMDALLFPIPVFELRTDPNLTQNPGY